MKPPGNQNIATWLMGLCQLSRTVRHWKITKGSSVSCLYLLQPVGWWNTQRKLNIRPSGERKGCFYICICLNTVWISSLPPWPPPQHIPCLLSVSSPHQHNSRLSIFRRLWRILINCSLAAVRTQARKEINTHPHCIWLFLMFSQTLTHNSQGMQTHSSFSILPLCEQEAEGSWRGRDGCMQQYSWIWKLQNSLNSVQQKPHKDGSSAGEPLFFFSGPEILTGFKRTNALTQLLT